MIKKIRHWFDSRRGKNTVITVLALALVLSIIGQVIGWDNIGRLIIGTAGPGMDGHSCLPTCVEDDGKFLIIPGADTASFAGAKIVVWIEAPIGQNSFVLDVFDGDSGKDNDGNLSMADGNWDNTETEVIFKIYADPERDATGMTLLGEWQGNTMPNNDWYSITIKNLQEARNPNGRYYYRLEASRPAEGGGGSLFKLRSTGQLSSGRSDLVDTAFGICGAPIVAGDVPILYPEFDGDYENPGPTNYSGDWEFFFDVPAGTDTLYIWDGDFDRGTSATASADTDDPNTVGIPAFADPLVTIPERAGGKGSPADDYVGGIFRREPPAWYEIIGPDGEPILTNTEPSGTEEWERFVVTSDPEMPDEEVDLRVDKIPAGIYTLHIGGLDASNAVWFRMNYEINPPECPECHVCEECDPCLPCECATATPTNTPEAKPTDTEIPPTKCADPKPVDLVYVLDVSGSMDQLYAGSGKKLEAAQEAIYELNKWVKDQDNDSRVALWTFHSAGKGRGRPPLYPTDIKMVSDFTANIDAFNKKVEGLDASGGTPTAEAMNDVTDWLPGAWDKNHLPVVILISDGVPTVDLETYGFQDYDVQRVDVYNKDGTARTIAQVRNSGKVYDAYGQRAGEPLADTMQEIQGLASEVPEAAVYAVAVQAVHGGIFNDEILRYAAAQTDGEFYMATDTQTLVESLQRAYVDSACGEDEAPGGETKPKEPPACTNLRTNKYTVENMTNKPFYSIKYQSVKGNTEIKNGKWDEFQFTITEDEAKALTSVKLQAKSGRYYDTSTIKDCDFAGTATCGPVGRRVKFSFQGAVDNGNGTMTLTFRVLDRRGRALSYVAIGLPQGVSPIWPDDTYQSEVCLDD